MRLRLRTLRAAFTLAPAAFLFGACSLPILSHVNLAGDAGPVPPPQVGEVVVTLALSGGGVRAAALAYGTMAELDRLRVPGPGGATSTLLREVDYFSSVSGGSFAAAYYALHRQDPAAFARFPDVVLHENHERKIAWRLFANPLNWFRVPLTDFDRTDVAARYYSTAIFGGKTFAALPAHPRLILNASDLVTGSRFEFTEEFFDCLGSDLKRFPLGYAVAASSAYPVGLAAVTLRNFGQKPERCLTVSDESNLRSRHLNAEGWLRATRKARFLQRERVPYVHLVDGGITDNLGLGAIQERIEDGEISDLLNLRRLKAVIVILVNAMPAHDTSFGTRSESPSFVGVADQSFGLMLEQASTRTSAAFQKTLDDWRASQRRLGRDVSFHFLEVRLVDLENPERRDRLLAAPTRLALPRSLVADLVGAGRDLLYCGGGQRRNAATLRGIVEVFYRVADAPPPDSAAPPVAC